MFDLKRFAALVPTTEPALQRLNHLVRTADEPPRIAVLGKYNHGKSSLLNVLADTDHFKVSDKRETVSISEYAHDGVIWVDTPGLDVDPTEIDDREANKVAFHIADFLFLVHHVIDGELDKYEVAAFTKLAKQDTNYRQKMTLVLTKIDQREPSDRATVERRCREQLQESVDLRELDTISVSVSRYRDSRLRAQSGMDSIFTMVWRMKADIQDLRRREWSRLTNKVLLELWEKQKEIESGLASAEHRRDRIQRRLSCGVRKLVRQLWEE